MSPTRWGLPTPSEATPYPGAPQFFRREWNGLTIFGYSCRSSYAEDLYLEDETWARRHAFPAVCMSKVEPDGEYGSVPLSDVTEITEAEFNVLVTA
jgi:hypothetical protein